ncbi:hypothetical protein CEXT_331501 [Caerostris extrusa]|uniref:Uncharacterized protein n=1 Tax=Caerostris extrusa TaxID=172846 RepID=A0AAV4NQW2_CAEEX|nr:hypothetical protein CEXT_331501 [Caerostris extrusa]
MHFSCNHGNGTHIPEAILIGSFVILPPEVSTFVLCGPNWLLIGGGCFQTERLLASSTARHDLIGCELNGVIQEHSISRVPFRFYSRNEPPPTQYRIVCPPPKISSAKFPNLHYPDERKLRIFRGMFINGGRAMFQSKQLLRQPPYTLTPPPFFIKPSYLVESGARRIFLIRGLG